MAEIKKNLVLWKHCESIVKFLCTYCAVVDNQVREKKWRYIWFVNTVKTKYHRPRASTTEIYFLLVLQGRNLRWISQQGWCLLRVIKEESIPILFSWLIGGCLFSLSSHHSLFVSVFIHWCQISSLNVGCGIL